MNTPGLAENTLQSDANPSPKKSVIINIRVPVDYAWTLKNQAVARAITVSDLVREKLLLTERLSLSLANPSSLEAKKKDSVLSNQGEEQVESKVERAAGPSKLPRIKLSSGRCEHGFSVYKSMTACPECKKL